jgi:hypothetical protein
MLSKILEIVEHLPEKHFRTLVILALSILLGTQCKLLLDVSVLKTEAADRAVQHEAKLGE